LSPGPSPTTPPTAIATLTCFSDRNTTVHLCQLTCQLWCR
jgi:hypothetical protein